MILGLPLELLERGEAALLVPISISFKICRGLQEGGDCYLVPCADVCSTTRGRTVWQLKACSDAGLPGYILFHHLDACYTLHLSFHICKIGMIMPLHGLAMRTKCMQSTVVNI